MEAANEKELQAKHRAMEALRTDLKLETLGKPMKFFKPGNANGFKITLINKSPSGSGMATSSALSANLLNVLYHASQQHQFIGEENRILLGSMVLLFENELKLKSGRQDPDGSIFPGVKSFEYSQTDGFVVPNQPVKVLDINEKDLAENLVLFNSGMKRREATDLKRNLNQRHFAFLSRDKKRYRAIRKSYGIHKEIEKALLEGNWPLLGRLFTEYMKLRTQIDPSATDSEFDEDVGDKVFNEMFDQMVNKGLIYGGMFTGQMGGGERRTTLGSSAAGDSKDNDEEGFPKRPYNLSLEMAN